MFGADQARFAIIINLLLFQGVWFLTVLGAAAGNGWIGLIGLGVFFIAHYLFAPQTAAADFRLAGVAAGLALIIETIIVQAGLFDYAAAIPGGGIAPLWLLVLWANFALTMNGCIAWLHHRYVLAGVLGALGGPLSYFGGFKLGAATTEQSILLVLAIIAVIYALVTPLLFYLAAKFAGIAKTDKPDP